MNEQEAVNQRLAVPVLRKMEIEEPKNEGGNKKQK